MVKEGVVLAGENFLHMLRDNRFAYVGGRYGSFKTALAIRLGIEFVERGWSKHILTNFPCVIATDLHRLESLDDCFIILDEAGVWLRDDMFRQVIAYPRKINLYMVMASKVEVPLKARMLNIQMGFNYWEWGIPLLRFTCALDEMRVKERVPLHWWHPSEVFGLWDTSYVVGSDRGLVKVINAAFGRIRNDEEVQLPKWAEDWGKWDKAVGRDDTVGTGVHELEEARRVAETNYEAAARMEEAVSIYRRAKRKKARY